MRINTQSDPTANMTTAKHDPLSFLNTESSGLQNNPQIGASILNEVVAEAYNSLVNYDVELMNKYYDLLQNCD
jgi:hypothetical protein